MKRIIIGLFIVGLVFIFWININPNPNNKKNEDNDIKDSDFLTFSKAYDKMQNDIQNEEDFLVFLTTSDEGCRFCKGVYSLIKSYERDFNIKYLAFNIKNESELNKLNKQFGYPKGHLTLPAILVIKDGVEMGSANAIRSEAQIKELLIEFGFMDEKYKNIGIEMTKEVFNEYYGRKNNSLILIDIGKNYRDMITNLALKYNFQYGIIYAGDMNYYTAYMTLTNENEDIINGGLVVVNNNKVIDYTNVSKEEEVIEFLKKNKIVT